MSQQDRYLTQQLLQQLLHGSRLETPGAILAGRQTVRGGRENNLEAAGCVVVQQMLGITHIGLRDAQNRLDSGVNRRHHGAVDEAGTRFGVGRSTHDDELLGVGHDYAFRRVGIVSASA